MKLALFGAFAFTMIIMLMIYCAVNGILPIFLTPFLFVFILVPLGLSKSED